MANPIPNHQQMNISSEYSVPSRGFKNFDFKVNLSNNHFNNLTNYMAAPQDDLSGWVVSDEGPSKMDMEKTEQVWSDFQDSDSATEGRTSNSVSPLPYESFQPEINWHAQDSEGNSVSHRAAKAGNLLDLIALADIDPTLLTAPNGEGYTPMYLAGLEGHYRVMQFLEQVIPEYRAAMGEAPLSEAEAKMHVETVFNTEHIQRSMNDTGSLHLTPNHLVQRNRTPLSSASRVIEQLQLHRYPTPSDRLHLNPEDLQSIPMNKNVMLMDL